MTEFAQRIMMNLFKEDDLLPFLDDDYIATKKGEDHGKRVLHILEKITNANLRLNLEKCQFYKKEAIVLGFIATPEGIKTDPAKQKAILNWPLPKNGKGIQRFLGAVNFHQDFTKEFANKCAPLDSLRNYKKYIKWTDDLKQTFEEIKLLFAKQMELYYFDPEKLVYFTSDASDVAIAA